MIIMYETFEIPDERDDFMRKNIGSGEAEMAARRPYRYRPA